MEIAPQQAAPLVLASRSQTRRRILEGLGLRFEAIPADLPETALLAELNAAGLSIPSQAMILAATKAQVVASRAPREAVIIGSDQILDFDGAALETPVNPEAARDRLRMLRGKRHDLVAAVALVHRGRMAGQAFERVAIWMRDYSDAELDAYFDLAPPADLETVGAYAFESLGARLIERVEGDWFAALGMPVWPLLRRLRALSTE
ncbi:MAG: nucleoside triphosphate pyrophosphatase [Pseudomonadota bacterium]